MPDSEDQPHRPAQFAAALDAIRHSSPRPELVVTEIPAPGNLAPFSVALSADVTPVRHGSDSDFGTGRFILLYDPDEPESWGGPFRVVCFAQAPLETDIGIDPFLAEVAWAWLVDALDTRGANYTAASGTATKVLSSGFGELAHQGDGAQIELRASWSPLDNDLAAHVEGWGELLCMLAGLPPAGEPPLPPRHRHPSDAPTAEQSPGTHSSRHGRPDGDTPQNPAGGTFVHPTGASPAEADHTATGLDDSTAAASPGSDRRASDRRASDSSAPDRGRPAGIMLGSVDQIGPSSTSVRRTGPGLHTLGVAVAGLDSGGLETVGVDSTVLDTLGADSAGRETAGMSVMAVDTVGTDTGNIGLGLTPGILGRPAPSLAGVADLSAHRAARG